MKKIKFFTLLVCSSTLVIAQKNKPQTDSLKEVSLDEITLSATRFKENKNYLSQQVHTADADKIAFYNQQTSAELLSHTGNVLVQKSQLGGGSPVIRGFEANKVLITIDGVRMNNAIYRGGHLQNVLTIESSILDRLEILFGPSSVMYGSDALGGVLSFYTKSPELSSTAKKTIIKANASTRYATAYNEKNGHIDFTVAGHKLASLSSLTISDFGDLRQGAHYYKAYPDWGKRNFYVLNINGVDSMIKNANPNKQVQTGYTQYDFLQKFLFKTGKIEHILNFQYSTSSDIFRYDRLTETNNAGIAKSAEWYYGPQKRFLGAWNFKLPASVFYDKSQIIASFQDIEESRHNRNFRSTKRNHRIEQVKILSLNADFMKKIKQTEFSYGTELTYNKVKSKAYAQNVQTGLQSPLDTRYPDGGSNTQSYALYSTILQKFSEIIIGNAGVRLTHNRLYSAFNDKTFFPFPFNDIQQTSNALSGNVGLVLLPGSGWKISTSVSSGFRNPNVDDMSKVFESAAGTLIIPNPDIKPEKTINYELGISKKISQIKYSGSIWYTKFKDVLTTDFSSFNGSSTIIYNGNTSNVVTIVNKNKAYMWGFSTNLEANINTYITISSVINYTFGRIIENPDNYPMDHISPVFGKTNITAKYGRLTLELFSLYNAAKKAKNYNLRGEDNHQFSADPVNGFTPGWVTANFRSACKINNHASIQLALENIFDKYYRVFASGLSAPGRNLIITFRTNL